MILYFASAHFLLMLIYVAAFRDAHKQHFFCDLLILAFLPFAGFIFLVYSRWLRRHLQSCGVASDKQEQLDALLERDKNIETISVQVRQSADVVPLDDVLYLEDVTEKHKLLTTAIRQSALVDSSILKHAILDKDREVAHYAVSMATNSVSVMEKQISQLEGQWEKRMHNPAYLKQYAEILRRYIMLGIVEEFTLAKLKLRYEEILERIISLEDDAYYLEKLVDLLSAGGEYARAEKILDGYNARHPEQEQGYLLLLKIYVLQKRHDYVERLLARLKRSKIRFSAEGMRLVRFWS